MYAEFEIKVILKDANTHIWAFLDLKTWRRTVQFKWAQKLRNQLATFYSDLSHKFLYSILYSI